MIKKIISSIGFIIFVWTLLLVLFDKKTVRYSKIKIEGGKIVSKDTVSSRSSILYDNIVYAQNIFFSFDSGKLGTLKIEAEKSVYNLKTGVIELTGKVKMKAKNIYAETEKAKIFLDGKIIKKIEGYGNVKVETDGKVIKSEKVEIFPEEKVIVFSRNPTIYQKGMEIRGKTIKVFLDSDRVEVEETKVKSEQDNSKP